VSQFSVWLDTAMKEGHDGGAYFWVMPVKIVDDGTGNNWNRCILEHTQEEFSIDEDVVESFLWYFLVKHYNQNLSLAYRKLDSDDYIDENFEWNLEHNVYTYDGLKEMLLDIRETSALLENDFGNPSLSELRKRFPCWANETAFSKAWASICSGNNMGTGGKAKDTWWESDWEGKDTDIGAVVDFYRRFCKRMEKMMESSPEFRDISFMGP